MAVFSTLSGFGCLVFRVFPNWSKQAKLWTHAVCLTLGKRVNIQNLELRGRRLKANFRNQKFVEPRTKITPGKAFISAIVGTADKWIKRSGHGESHVYTTHAIIGFAFTIIFGIQLVTGFIFFLKVCTQELLKQSQKKSERVHRNALHKRLIVNVNLRFKLSFQPFDYLLRRYFQRYRAKLLYWHIIWGFIIFAAIASATFSEGFSIL